MVLLLLLLLSLLMLCLLLLSLLLLLCLLLRQMSNARTITVQRESVETPLSHLSFNMANYCFVFR
jgi:hypothetical protein